MVEPGIKPVLAQVEVNLVVLQHNTLSAVSMTGEVCKLILKYILFTEKIPTSNVPILYYGIKFQYLVSRINDNPKWQCYYEVSNFNFKFRFS